VATLGSLFAMAWVAGELAGTTAEAPMTPSLFSAKVAWGLSLWLTWIGLLALVTLLLAHPESQASRLRDALGNLGAVAPEDCPPLLALCRNHRTLATYQSRVAEMGRLLVDGEAKAFMEWDEMAAQREAAERCLAEQRAAFEQLKVPQA